jgi:fusion protein PurCD
MNTLNDFTIGQLKYLHRGKVREIYAHGPDELLIVATDRLSAFDKVLDSPIPGKGAVLSSLAAWWFEQTADIIPNHHLRVVDPSACLVKRCDPVKIEVIVRGYLCGSMWRRYQAGERSFEGHVLPDGLTENAQLPKPIVTPTTKEKIDRPISPAAIISEGWTTQELWDRMEAAALRLFERGTRILGERDIILVDTKYEFGLLGEVLVLIDEIHTPDSSRFWPADSWREDPAKAVQLDKEFVRKWLMANRKDGQVPDCLPAEVVKETTQRYREIFERITGKAAPSLPRDAGSRLYRNLVNQGVIREGFVVIIMGSPIDEPHCAKIKGMVEAYDIASHMRVVSAHKNGERILGMADFYNRSIEPGAAIAVAGLSNGLGGALAANLVIPVINAPPVVDRSDLMVNIHSSLMMPSRTPAATVVKPANAAQFALRSLNLPSLRRRFADEILANKEEMIAKDDEMRER